jgi:hypothetical protein
MRGTGTTFHLVSHSILTLKEGTVHILAFHSLFDSALALGIILCQDSFNCKRQNSIFNSLKPGRESFGSSN